MEAGSFLPWAELEIRKALASRDDEGQATAVSQEDVQHAVDRLSAPAGDGLANNVREKIERAADAS